MALKLPDVPWVREQLTEGTQITFLSIALGILVRLEKEFNTRHDEIAFLKDCLRATREKTSMPCSLAEDTQNEAVEASNLMAYNNTRAGSKIKPPAPKKIGPRQDYHLRGSLYTVSKAIKSGERPDPASSHDASQGVPWMGPVVPQFPAPDIPEDAGVKIDTFLKDHFNSWSFDVFALYRLTNGLPLQFTGWEAMCRGGCFNEFHIDPAKTSSFLQKAEPLYASEKEVRYHNNIHAADVTQTMHSFMSDLRLGALFNPMDVLAALLAAIVHDIGHDGRNNAFHVATQDDLAMTYNDLSVLESFHASTGFRLLLFEEESNMLSGLQKQQFNIVRKEVIDMVLGTDMVHHFKWMSEFQELVSKLGADRDAWQATDGQMYALRAMILHAADTSNQAKMLNLAQLWSERALREFFSQGDEERRLGIPVSPLCDRATTSVAASQIGFIQFIVRPTFSLVAQLLPGANAFCVKDVDYNLETWRRRKENGDYELGSDDEDLSFEQRPRSSRRDSGGDPTGGGQLVEDQRISSLLNRDGPDQGVALYERSDRGGSAEQSSLRSAAAEQSGLAATSGLADRPPQPSACADPGLSQARAEPLGEGDIPLKPLVSGARDNGWRSRFAVSPHLTRCNLVSKEKQPPERLVAWS